ncbi:DNA repair protein RecO [Candidatus Saccharibacteria bacterium]|nr:DNA repair protein RecO [Candidatus Saccharibacteria bacterium]
MTEDLKTLAIVLRRTNYGEADRILNLITPEGKVSAIAKSVRKAKSKLAGGVEMFTLSKVQIHQGRSELGIVTSAQMVKHYGEILKDYDRMTLAGMALRRVAKAAEHTDSPEWFELTRQVLAELDNGTNVALIEMWFLLNLLRVSGEEVNLYRDTEGEVLQAGARYNWNIGDQAFTREEQGDYGENEIKILRLATGVELAKMKRIKTEVDLWEKVLNLARIMAKN